MMSVDVSGDNLTLIWTVTANDHTEVIDKDNQHYVLEAQNKVICSLAIILMFVVARLTYFEHLLM